MRWIVQKTADGATALVARRVTDEIVPRSRLPAAASWRSDRPGRRACCGTIVAMSVEPLRSVRDHLSEFVDRAEREHERIIVTRNGRPAAVLLAYDDLAALEETLDVLSDPAALADIREADAQVERGEVVHGVDAVRALRPRP